MRAPRPASTRPTALAALLLIAGLAALPPAGGQEVNVADLQMVSVLAGAQRVNQTNNVSAVVYNNGPTAVLTWSVSFGWGNSSTPLASNSTVTWPIHQDHFTNQVPPGCLSINNGFARNCTVTVSFGWTPEPPPSERIGLGNVSALADVGTGYSDPVGANNELRAPVFVEFHRLALVLEPLDNHPKQARPGEAAFYRLAVQNTGNLNDTVDLILDAPEWDFTSGLVANGFDEPSFFVRKPLAQGGTMRFLALMIPFDFDRHPTGHGNVTAAPAVAHNLNNATLALPPTNVAQGATAHYGIALQVPSVLVVPSGGSADLGALVRNTASNEDAVRWTLPTGAPANWTAAFVDEWLGLDAGVGSTSAAVLHVSADPSLPAGTAVPLQLQARSFNSGAMPLVNVTLRTPAPDLELASMVLDRPAVYAGDAVLVQTEVRNAGDAPLPRPARLVLSVLQGGNRTSVAEEVVGDLAPGATRGLVLRWETRDVVGNITLEAALDPGQEIPEVRKDNNNASVPLVVRLHGLELRAPPELASPAGVLVSFSGNASFAVRNLGNAPESVLLTFTTEHGWLNTTRTLAIDPGETLPVDVDVQVPTFPGTLREMVLAEAVLANRSATRAANRTAVNIVDHDAPVLERLDAPAFVELGTPAAFVATLRDAVGVREAVLHLRLADGSARNESLGQRANDTWAAEVVLATPGPVGFWVTAKDRANNTLDTSASQGALVVGVRSAPLVELVQPRNNSALRPGTLLQFRISDIHGIASVVARDGPRSFDLDPPYALSTAGWPEGPHTVEVTARNPYGNAATASFRFTFDGTPPTVQDARVAPDRPKPGEDFRIEARTSADADSASIRILRDNQLVREVAASAGLGSVTGNLSIADPGRYVLVVRVEDAAGNAGSLDVPVEVSAGLPAAPEALVAIAVGLAALGRGRKR